MDGPFNAVEFADFIGSRWRVFAISSTVALSLSLTVSWLIPRRYTATATIMIGAPLGNDPRAATSVNAVYLESLRGYESLALSDTVFARALDSLKIQEGRGAPVESFRHDVLKVSKKPNTAILEIQATLKNPREAQALAQYIAEQTVELSKSIGARSSNDATRELRDQLSAARSRLEKASQAKSDFALATPVEIPESELRTSVELKSTLDRDLVVARTDLAGLNAREPTSQDSASSVLQARMAAIESQRNRLDAVIAQQSAQLASRKSRRDAIVAEQESAQRTFEAAGDKLNDAVSAASNRSESLQIIDPGIVPGQPGYPNTLLNLLAALLVSLAGSAVWLACRFSYSRLASERSARMLTRRQRHDIDLPIPR